MRTAGFKWMRYGAIALLATGVIAGCENPLDPINKSEKIEGLSFIDVSATWDRWDSDPEYDGVSISVDYFNELGSGLSFHDKPHKVVIEFWTSKDTSKEESTTSTTTTSTTTSASTSGGLIRLGKSWTAGARNAARPSFTAAGLLIQEKLWFTKTIQFSDSDDAIRIPIEAYSRNLPPCEIVATAAPTTTTTTTTEPETAAPTTCESKGFLVVRVFPPQDFPRPELVVAQSDVTFFKPVVEENAPNP